MNRDHYRHLTRTEKFVRRGAPALLALGAVAGWAATETAAAINNKSEEHLVGTARVEVELGSTAINAVRQGANEIAEKAGIDPASVPSAVYPGQQANQEIAERTGSSLVKPGEDIFVTITKDGFGNYDLEAHDEPPQR